ncbi:methylated-DNA--[protein]-cysteine S-methyltransferase [Spirochaeta dissipatitropha]
MQQRYIYYNIIDTPLGSLYLSVDKSGHLLHIGLNTPPPFIETAERNKYACGEAEQQIKEYFSGARICFDLPVKLKGTDFQRAVWSRLQKQPYGTTISYAELALKIGNRHAARAVGGALARNPVPIIIPCHRVILSSGEIGSYALRSKPDGSGKEQKQYLIELEQKFRIEDDSCSA